MENTYQDLITDIQSKNPKISGKLEGGRKFKIKSDFKPAGDQPEAIKNLVKGAKKNQFNQVLLGVTGSGKTFTMAKVIEETNRPALILAPNKTLAAQLYGEMKGFFPDNAVEYFVSYYDYYTPECNNRSRTQNIPQHCLEKNLSSHRIAEQQEFYLVQVLKLVCLFLQLL